MKHLSYLNKYFLRYKSRLLLGIIFIIITNLFAIVSPKIVEYAFNLVNESITIFTDVKEGGAYVNPDSLDTVTQYVPFVKEWLSFDNEANYLKSIGVLTLLLSCLYLILALLKGLFLFFTRQTIIIMSRLIEYDLKNEIFNQYQRLSMSFYKRNNTGDIMNRISEDVGKVRMYLGPAIMYTINLIILFILSIIAMLNVNVELTLYVLVPLPIMSYSIYKVSNMINRKSEHVQRQQSALSTFVQEAFSGIRVLKAYNRTDASSQDFANACEDYKGKSLTLVKVDALFHPIIILLIGLSTIITIYIGGVQVLAGEITIGVVASFVIYVNMLTWPFAAVGWVTSLVQRAAASQERINEFLKIVPEISAAPNPKLFSVGDINFNKVGYTYPDSGIVALNDVSFTIKQGETVAIIGKTGSGKTTIAHLLTRQYDVTSGTLTINNQAIDGLSLASLRQQIGYVPQDVFLFSDSISNNIGFGLEESDDRQRKIEQAAKDADVYENITGFKNGFKTILGERGITLSGGQKQRVSIARAIVKEPDILIFDDCLSAVDTATEEKILTSLKSIMLNKTSLIISHRVSTIKHAHKIIFLENGKIAEEGTHDQLIDSQGFYYELFQKQLLEEEKTSQ
ncbi:MAG: ATP-binding cassette subfamily B multidrug efflux pump [Flavobacteriales bacterium]|jgi:ATP-binding cassette subfamily B multidrug efflux pump